MQQDITCPEPSHFKLDVPPTGPKLLYKNKFNETDTVGDSDIRDFHGGFCFFFIAMNLFYLKYFETRPYTVHYTRHKSLLVGRKPKPLQKHYIRAERQSDGPTDRRTDIPSYKL